MDEIKKQARKERKVILREDALREKEEENERWAYYVGLEEMQDLDGRNRGVDE